MTDQERQIEADKRMAEYLSKVDSMLVEHAITYGKLWKDVTLEQVTKFFPETCYVAVKALGILAQAYEENIEEAFEIRDGVRSVYERLQDEQLVNSIIDLPRKDQKALLKRIKEMRKEKTE